MLGARALHVQMHRPRLAVQGTPKHRLLVVEEILQLLPESLVQL